MNIALWIIQILLAVAFLAVGGAKVAISGDKIRATGLGAEPWLIRLLGVAEVLGAVGIIVPGLTGILPVLTPLAAIGLAFVALGALVLHLRRKEYKAVTAPTVLLILAVVVAWGRLHFS